ncbi:dihydrodipicolinate synthase family protein [Alkalihalobacillus trypoxylicola]|uniref:dihydrodipicolinate synthase family protein n=1 Tax=Alkalihalobacillus trypoxylicola TaxID=519424 RepID=UPI001F2AEE52|nr:dihydrodipicolinate synthase family protein [Alkalihalobacillus trypoxylicola]
MKECNPIKGVIPPISTIFLEDGTFDEVGMSRLIENLISRHVDGLFFLGTGGEFSQLSLSQRKEIAEFAVKKVDKRVPVLIGTGATSTDDVISLNEHAYSIGADAVVVINPYYLKLSEEKLLEHYHLIAKKSKLPILLYNFPALTGQDLSPDLVSSLVAEHQNIVGIKETVSDIGHVREMIIKTKKINPHFSVLCGFEDLLLNSLSLGGDGIISASGNFAPEWSTGLIHSYHEGDYEKVMSLQRHLVYIPEIYKLDTPFINVIKKAITLCGLEVSEKVLAPAHDLSEEKTEALISILKEVQLVKNS